MVSKRSWHSKARNVFVEVPYTLWTDIPPSLVFECFDSATMRENSSLLIWLVSFVIAIKWISRENFIPCNWLSGGFSCQYRSWITHIRTKNLVSHYQNRDTGGSTEVYIDSRVIIESTVRYFKGLSKGIFNLIRVDNSLLMLGLIEYPLDLPLDIWSKLWFYKFWNFLSIEAMTITNSKKMSSAVLS